MKTTIQFLVPASLIVLFTYAAINKIQDPGVFRSQLYRQPFSHEMANALLYLLPISELVTVALLLFKPTRFAGLIISAGLLTIFSLYILTGLLNFWGKIPCSCGGILNHLSWQIHLIFNLTFLLANLVAIVAFHAERIATGSGRQL